MLFWALGLIAVLYAILMVIYRMAMARYRDSIAVPWIRAGAPLIGGLLSLSLAAFLLGVRDGLRTAWMIIAIVLVLVIALGLLVERFNNA